MCGIDRLIAGAKVKKVAIGKTEGEKVKLTES
jgi:hypothetical protein